VAISVGHEFAELVPNEMRNLLLRVCFGYASQPLPLLAMTRGGESKLRLSGNKKAGGELTISGEWC